MTSPSSATCGGSDCSSVSSWSRTGGSLAPAARQAGYVVNRLKDRGVLVSTDGPLHNVIKIKPPLPFSSQDADRLVEALRETLAEDGARP